MKQIQKFVNLRIPEKQDIVNSFDELSNIEIGQFVCEVEQIIDEQTIDKNSQFHKVREDENFTEYYSIKTAIVYRVVRYDGMLFFEAIHFKESRPQNIGYGVDANSKKARAYCTKCNTLIFSGPDLIGRKNNWCDCK
jgi:hypothetical protein